MRRRALSVVSVLVWLAGVLVLPATVVGAAESDGSDVSLTRYGGADRYATSLLIAEAVAVEAGGSLANVVLVSGERWADAVVAAPLAASLAAPVLMTPPDELRADALEFLRRMGVSKAVVVGPEAGGGRHGPGRGVSAEVFEALGAAGIAAGRVSGDDRFGTGVAAAEQVTPGDMGTLGRTAVIASGDVFADALVAGPFAARGIHPVLLTPPGELHAEVASYLGDAAISHVVLMGGPAALSGIVEQAVEGLGMSVSRVSGSTRYDTAVKAAELVDGRYSEAAGRPCFVTSTIGMARARVPFDSFSAAPLLGQLCAPLVLTDPGDIPDDTAAYLDAAREIHDGVGLQVFGGDAAVSQAAIDAYRTGEDGLANDDKPSTGPAPDLSSCRPRGLDSFTAGFPLPDWAPSAHGTLRIAVLFLDFPDAQAAFSTEEEASRGNLAWAEQYLESVSYGKLDVEFVPLHRWLRAEQALSTYYSEDQGFAGSFSTLSARSVALADGDIDFSTFDMAVTVLPSNHFIAAGLAGGTAAADDDTVKTLLLNTQRRTEAQGEGYFRWGYTLPHEILHNLGLLDLYPYDGSLHTRPQAPSGHVWVAVQWGAMRLDVWYLAPQGDPLRRQVYRYPDSRRLEFAGRILDPDEPLAWSRWQLGWLDSSQVRCESGSESSTVRLAPIAQPGDGLAMAVLPINSHEVIVIESRRKLGYDLPRDHITVYDGAITNLPRLITEGVLVYTVDTLIGSGQLPMKIAGDSGNGQVDDFPVLRVGESVTVRGYTVTVTADDGDTHTVSIARES
ncbi:MAG: cell wall-binding repeat-containing protein [Acidimicrobiaceae bacterium]|nr:cell wall-binding repeat-containing protein [Acidimicrobiaceae bacterium]